MGRHLNHFEIIPRGRRVKPHLAAIRRASAKFKRSRDAGDTDGMQHASVKAWDSLASTFEILRGEHDDGFLADSYMRVPTGLIVERPTAAQQGAMIAAAKLDRRHARCGPLTLREALNKIAHYRSDAATYRVDGRGAHYLILGGNRGSQRWVAEILVAKLVRNAAAAAAAIRWHP